MVFILNILIIVLVLGIVVFVHELGHLIACKLSKVRYYDKYKDHNDITIGIVTDLNSKNVKFNKNSYDYEILDTLINYKIKEVSNKKIKLDTTQFLED